MWFKCPETNFTTVDRKSLNYYEDEETQNMIFAISSDISRFCIQEINVSNNHPYNLL